MAFNVNYSFNNGDETGTATSITDLRTAITTYASTGVAPGSYDHLTQCTLSGTVDELIYTDQYMGPVGIFSNLTKLKEIDLSNLDMRTVTNVTGLFLNCYSLDTITGIGDLNVKNVTNMSGMFDECRALEELDLANWEPYAVTNVNSMFYGCTNLKKVSNLNLYSITDMTSMFKNAGHTSGLMLNNFKYQPVSPVYGGSPANMSHMFENCNSSKIYIADLDTNFVTNMNSMFKNCTNLEHIYGSLVTNTVTDSTDMFTGCTKLPNFDSSKTDASMAKSTFLGGYLEEGVTSREVVIVWEDDNQPELRAEQVNLKYTDTIESTGVQREQNITLTSANVSPVYNYMWFTRIKIEYIDTNWNKISGWNVDITNPSDIVGYTITKVGTGFMHNLTLAGPEPEPDPSHFIDTANFITEHNAVAAMYTEGIKLL